MNSPRGFTLLEMLLVIASFAVIAAMSIPVYQSFQVKNDLDVAAFATAHSVRRAQQLAMNMSVDSVWGVSAQTGSITVFKGMSYATRDTDYDEVFTIATSITPSGTTEYVFAKMTGLPGATGTTMLTSTNGDNITLTINAKGIVTY